jgi:glyoxylase-like metal-dependent hydrolase (beta-lactamase superfamily II)
VREKAGTRGVRRYVLDRWRDDTLPVNAFLVEHPEGLCLFDTGQTARAAEPGYFPAWQPFFRLARFELEPADEASALLERLGFDAADVRWVVLSHLHTDHVGGLAAFASADVIVAREEWTAAAGMSGRIRGYLPQEWPAGLEPRLVELDGPAVGPFTGSYDVAGDGRLLLVPLPGHTRGHSALLVRDDERRWLLAGDAAHSAGELAATAPQVAEFCAHEGVVVLTAHDAEAEALLA